MKPINSGSFACVLFLSVCAIASSRAIASPTEPPAEVPQPTKIFAPKTPGFCAAPHTPAEVNLAFTLEPDGAVSHIQVLAETPKSCGYGAEAIFAFRKWRFVPHMENGVAVPFNATYRLTFKQP